MNTRSLILGRVSEAVDEVLNGMPMYLMSHDDWDSSIPPWTIRNRLRDRLVKLQMQIEHGNAQQIDEVLNELARLGQVVQEVNA